MIEVAFLALLLLWLGFNWLAPFTLLIRAEPMSAGRVASDLAIHARAAGARLYTARLEHPGGFSVLAWPLRLVIFDRDSLALTPAWAWRFLIAHELGHCALGHLQARWLLTVTGLCLLPAGRRWLVEMEHEADAYAERLTGLSAESFHQPEGVNA